MAITIEHRMPGAPWNDSSGMAIALKDVGSNIPTIEQYGSSGLYYPNFDAVDDMLVFSLQLDHRYKPGSNIEFHVHAKTSTTSVNVVRWKLTYQWVNIDGAFSNSTSTSPTDVDMTPTEDKHQLAQWAALSGTGKTVSSALSGSIKRITNGATDYTGEVYLLFADYHFQGDTHGSRTATAK
jgi:hypothetical protein